MIGTGAQPGVAAPAADKLLITPEQAGNSSMPWSLTAYCGHRPAAVPMTQGYRIALQAATIPGNGYTQDWPAGAVAYRHILALRQALPDALHPPFAQFLQQDSEALARWQAEAEQQHP